MEAIHTLFKEVWCVDFEFIASPGERPQVVCMVAHELKSGQRLKLWGSELVHGRCPIDFGDDTLMVAYFATAEIDCFLSLGWSTPTRILDLYVEFRNLCNSEDKEHGYSIIHALQCFGISSIDAVEKDQMRNLILGGVYSDADREAILKYCESDVDALSALLPAMAAKIDLARAVYRGRFMWACSRMQHNGIRVDADILGRLSKNWEAIKTRLIREIDQDYHVFDGTTFKYANFEAWLTAHNVPWPRYENAKLDLTDDTFKEMARCYPAVSRLRELRVTLSQLRLMNLAVGKDGRNRCLLSPFAAITSRNQPSNKQFIFGPSTWARSLIKPERGYGMAYIDWSQQEFGIAAALSQDDAMKEAYLSADPYMTFAILAGAAPKGATKKSHAEVRELFKACVLAVQYGMGAKTLALRIQKPEIAAQHLLDLHRKTFPAYWHWSEQVLNYAQLHQGLHTVFGWSIRVGKRNNTRSLCNFPVQANGAEMMRLAAIYGIERGVSVCAPIHDAFLIEAPLEQLEQSILTMQEAMSDASALILDGFRLRSDVKVVRHPDRYTDERGSEMWEKIMRILAEVEHERD